MKYGRDATDYVRDILDAVLKARRFTEDVAFEDFAALQASIEHMLAALE